jgi:hypothetical protein
MSSQTAQPPAAPAKGTKKPKTGAARIKKAATVKYSVLIEDAIRAEVQKNGTSIAAIKKHIQANYPAAKPIFVLKHIRAMEKDGRLVPGAKAGRKGAGSFKLPRVSYRAGEVIWLLIPFFFPGQGGPEGQAQEGGQEVG